MLLDVFLFIIVMALLGVIIFLQLRHEAERRDLYNRIMAGNVDDYNVIKGDTKAPTTHRPITNRRIRQNEYLKSVYEEEKGE